MRVKQIKECEFKNLNLNSILREILDYIRPINEEKVIIKTKKLTIGGIALFPFIILNSKLSLERQETLINHEKIHLRQQLELLVLPFYILYLANYLINLFIYKNHQKAYRNIIFEKEAFENEKRNDYLKSRKIWAFINFI